MVRWDTVPQGGRLSRSTTTEAAISLTDVLRYRRWKESAQLMFRAATLPKAID